MKELQGLTRILDTLAYAFEFIMMPTPSEQAQGLEELRRSILRCYPELKVPVTRSTEPPALLHILPGFRESCAGAPCPVPWNPRCPSAHAGCAAHPTGALAQSSVIFADHLLASR